MNAGRVSSKCCDKKALDFIALNIKNELACCCTSNFMCQTGYCSLNSGQCHQVATVFRSPEENNALFDYGIDTNIIVEIVDIYRSLLIILRKKMLVVCKVLLRTIILRDNIIRKHWWTINNITYMLQLRYNKRNMVI